MTNDYISILRRAKIENRCKGKDVELQSHHIFPKSLFPEFKHVRWNRVLLTEKEHAKIHHLIPQKFKDRRDFLKYESHLEILNDTGKCRINSARKSVGIILHGNEAPAAKMLPRMPKQYWSAIGTKPWETY